MGNRRRPLKKGEKKDSKTPNRAAPSAHVACVAPICEGGFDWISSGCALAACSASGPRASLLPMRRDDAPISISEPAGDDDALY